MVLNNGPLLSVLVSNISYETVISKDLPTKFVKNIPKTLTFRNQVNSLSQTVHKSRWRNFFLATHKLIATTIGFLPGSELISLRTSLGPQSFVYTTTKVQVWGRRYSVGNVLILGKCPVEHELQFGLIHKIIWIPEVKSVYFLVKKLITLGFVHT